MEMGNWSCLQCGKDIDMFEEICPHCGTNQYGEHEEYKPTAETYHQINRLFKHKGVKQKKKRGFSEEEILALGLYPKDEGYKMSLISIILNKK